MITYSLDSGWAFWKKGTERRIPVTIPHDAMIHEKRDPACLNGMNTGYYPGGCYYYEKMLEIPKPLAGKSIWLEFEGIQGISRVFVNGEEAGEIDFGYADHFMRIDGLLHYGETNILTVEADNSGELNSRWYTGSGLYRPVSLHIADKIHVAVNGLKIRTRSFEPACVEVHVALENDGTADADTCLEIAVLTKEKTILDKKEIRMVLPTKERTERTFSFTLTGARLWSAEDPYLHECRVRLRDGSGCLLDETCARFGIREVSGSAGKGLQVNGRTIKLYGACLHHDNGLLGAATYPAAEYRRIRKLKELGYNAVRSAHNPASKAMLDACDELGMYLIDELYDMWLIHKTPNDYADRVQDNYLRDIQEMVDKDYNHPSVILYSIGNEVSETAGADGVAFAGKLAEAFMRLDSGRLITANINFKLNCLAAMGIGIYRNTDREEQADGHKRAANLAGSAFANYLSDKIHFLMEKLTATGLADRTTKEVFKRMDIAGYSYGQKRYRKDFVLHPGRIILGSETYISDLPASYRLMQNNSQLIGDFVWTGWDYLGETGIGSFEYESESIPDTGYFKSYPWMLASSGMIDITGKPTVHGYYAQTIYRQLTRPFIAVTQPDHYGERHSRSSWNFTNAIPSWSFEGYEKTPVTIEIYSAAPSVEVLINGRSIGQKACGSGADYRAVFHAKYESGRITARSYDTDGRLLGEKSLSTAGGGKRLRITPEYARGREGEDSLIFVDMELCDDDGTVKVMEKERLQVAVCGSADLIAVGSARACTTDSFTGDSCHTYHGRAQAVLRTKADSGVIRICVRWSGGEQTVDLSLPWRGQERESGVKKT